MKPVNQINIESILDAKFLQTRHTYPNIYALYRKGEMLSIIRIFIFTRIINSKYRPLVTFLLPKIFSLTNGVSLFETYMRSSVGKVHI